MRKVLFIIDRIELKYFEFNDLVTNFWFIKEFLQRGSKVAIATIDHLFIKDSNAYANVFDSYIEDGDIKYSKNQQRFLINDFDMVMFRPDPPVDMDYIEATYVFDFVDETKTVLLNNPCAIRNFNEKLHITYFPEYTPENIVTADASLIKEFLETHNQAVVKPLNRCFGSGVFFLDKNDINLNTIIKTATNDGKNLVMIQRYLAGARNGDKRVLLLGEEVLEECVIKAPLDNDFKFSQHNDNYLRATSLTPKERELATAVAKKLSPMGLPLVGLDLLDEKIIEINITSPCYFIREINNLYGVRLENKIMPFIELKFLDKVLTK
jgi:glutathione synthase